MPLIEGIYLERELQVTNHLYTISFLIQYHESTQYWIMWTASIDALQRTYSIIAWPTQRRAVLSDTEELCPQQQPTIAAKQ